MIKQTMLQLAQAFVRWPTKYKILGILLVVVVAIATGWLWPRHVVFSYRQATCTNQFIIAPGIFRSISTDGFKVSAGGQVKVAGVALFATQACVTPVEAPKEGTHQVAIAPLGWKIIAKTIHVDVAKPPIASIKPLEKQVAATLPLKLPLDGPDEVFSYQLAVNDKRLACETEMQHIECDLKKLNLNQGTSYNLALERYFNGKRVATIVSKPIETLRATNVVGVSIKQGEIVFSKPRSMQFKLDKKIEKAEVRLTKTGSGEPVVYATKSIVTSDTIEVTWEQDLARSSSYEVVLDNVIAHDGSTLVNAYKLPFTVSGGPKVTGINIGRSKVPLGATATITFDQPLLEAQDIKKAVTVTGGASITSVKGNVLTIGTTSVPKCGTFTIAINDALTSQFEITGGSTWKYSARTICHSIGTIGSSVKGRSITAYYFGSGPNSIIYTGAIHGDEVSTRSLMLRWIDELEANAQNIPADRTIVVVPLLNPDGFAAGRRTNANNVDLNRNFNVSDWKKDITTVTNKPFPGGGGPEPMSEPETKALANLVARLQPRLVLSYHSIGGIVAANQSGDSGMLAASYARMSGYRNATGSTSSVFEYQISGTADDYFAERLGVRSVLIELGSHTYHQFDRNQKAMWEMLRS